MSQDKYATIRREAAEARKKLPQPVRHGSSQVRAIAVGLVNPLALLPLSNDRVERIAIASAGGALFSRPVRALFPPTPLPHPRAGAGGRGAPRPVGVSLLPPPSRPPFLHTPPPRQAGGEGGKKAPPPRR